MAKIIAEVSSNHLGNMDLAVKHIEEAAKAGADIVKFQSWQAKTLIDSWPDRQYYENAELKDDDHIFLKQVCEENNVEFLTTIFNIERLDFLSKLGMRAIKIASTDVNSFDMIKACTLQFEEVIISTGMHNLQEVYNLNRKLRDYIIERFEYDADNEPTFMYCVSEYPTPLSSINFEHMRMLPGDYYGFSDHSIGILAAKVACANHRCKYIEKHFITDKSILSKDAHICIDPDSLKDLCDWNKIVRGFYRNEPRIVSEQELKVREKFVGRWSKK